MDEKTKMLCAALGIVIVCFGYLFLVTFAAVPPSGVKYADMVTGAIISFLSGLIGFYWGSSKSSADKDTTINKQIQNAADVAAKEVR